MARPLRIELAGGLYHVTSRGDRREAIYRDDADRIAWLDLFGDVCERFNWRCHAYCEMTNHYHAVVETPEANLSKGMRQLNGVYTQSTNRRHGLVGHLFQGRFKAILVERDAYLLELARYVVLNPVRAGMVREAGDWVWSSYRAMVGQASAPGWLETDWLLGQFGEERAGAQAGYADFVRQGVGADRGEAMARAFATGVYTMQEIAAFFGVHYSTVSRAVRRFRV
jgi:putative transposase